MHKLLLISVVLILSVPPRAFAQDSPARPSREMTISGVKVAFTVDAQTFPESWQTEEIDAYGVSLNPQEISRSMAVLKKALEKYPQQVLTQNLVKIYVLKSIRFYGVDFGGTNSSDVVYITNNGIENGYTGDYLEKTFHHEFSSILLRNFPDLLDAKAWVKNNRQPYGNGGVEAIVSGQDGLSYDESLMPDGFLIQYAASDMENDFNTFAESIFCPEKALWEYCDKYPGINNKMKMIIHFYSKLDSSFSSDYFKKLTPG